MVTTHTQPSGAGTRRSRNANRNTPAAFHHHPVCLQGLRAINAGGEPIILERTDQDFIAALLADLVSDVEAGANESGASRPGANGIGVSGIGVNGIRAIAPAITQTIAQQRNQDGVLRLFQPVHQVFHLVLLEAVCDLYDQPGLQPRLDPQRIESAGLVVRRLGTDLTTVEGWRQAGAKFRGWVAFDDSAISTQESDLDPDPEQRPPMLESGNAEINQRLLRSPSVPAPSALSETTSPLFVAPPSVCKAIGKTILYGVIPLASSEQNEVKETREYDLSFVQDHLPKYLKANCRCTVPLAKETVKGSEVTDTLLKNSPLLDSFVVMVRQVQIELNAFGSGPASTTLLTTLNQVSVPLDDDSSRPLGDFLADAAMVFVNRNPDAEVQMPSRWPKLKASNALAIAQAAKAALDNQLTTVMPRRGRFDDDQAHYHIRGFIRVRQPSPCPPKLVWSPISQPFTIVPWYDTGPVPPVSVTLPNITRESVQALKPNVAFSVPNDLFNLLQANKPSDLLDGNGKAAENAGIALDWICGFNIPIITICALLCCRFSYNCSTLSFGGCRLFGFVFHFHSPGGQANGTTQFAPHESNARGE